MPRALMDNLSQNAGSGVRQCLAPDLLFTSLKSLRPEQNVGNQLHSGNIWSLTIFMLA